jgi:hypothetical protein
VNSLERQERLRRLQRRSAIFAVVSIVVAVVGLIAGSGELFAAGAAFAVLEGVLVFLTGRGARG